MRQVPFRSAGRPRVHMWARFTVGAAGAVTLDETFSDPGIDLGDFSSGSAALTFPQAPKAVVRVQLTPAAIGNDQVPYVFSLNAPAGTATITVSDDGSAEDPADGAVVTVEIVAETRGG
jgi:hypothetical protein